MKIAYIVSLFPKLSETFILREMIGLTALGHQIAIVSLKRESEPVVHKEASLFRDRTIHPGLMGAMPGAAVTALRHPVLVMRIVARIVIAHAGGGRGFHPVAMLTCLALVPPALHLARRLRAMGIQHVHAHWATYPALVAWIIGRVSGIRYSVTAHAHDLFLPNPLLAEKLRDAAFFATISEFNRALLIQGCGPGALEKVRLIRCGIPLAEFPYGEPPLADAEPAHVVSVGRLVDYKGFDVLIRACWMLRDRGLPLRLTIVGDGPERKSLEALVGELKVTGMVTFAGSRRQEEVRGIMRHASLFALACVQGKDGQQDGIPIVLMEAMALGVPVVSTRLSGIPELVKDGQTGLLARPGDPQHLALAMERLLQDDALAASLRRDARTWVTIEFDLDRWVGQLSEALAEAHRP